MAELSKDGRRYKRYKTFEAISAAHEYGATQKQLDKFAQKANRELDADRKARRLKPFTGKLKRG
jgi:hypothetical protein